MTGPALATPAPSMIAPAEAAAAHALGKRIWLKTKQTKVVGDWGFLVAEMQAGGGAPVDYAGTRLASAAAQGMVSKDFVALLKRKGAQWTIVAQAVGPTDLVWETWPAEHGAPAALFR